MLFLGIDGCFKPKFKDRGITDPDLGTGLAYMVDEGDYAAHLEATVGTVHDKLVRMLLYSVCHGTYVHQSRRPVVLISMPSIRRTPGTRGVTSSPESSWFLAVIHSSVLPAS